MNEAQERARRTALIRDGARGPEGSVLTDLLERIDLPEIAARRGMPEGRVEGIASFYDLLPGGDARPHVCAGTACWSARGAGAPFPAGAAPVRCLGRCYEAPAATGAAIDDAPYPIPAISLAGEPAIFSWLAEGGAGGGAGAQDRLSPAEILARVEASGLRGRGGAAYPTGAKWRAAAQASGARKYVVVNGDEGDPGSFVDRLLLERAPEAVLGGLDACAAAIGATEGIVFIRAEYPHAAARVRAAIAAAEGSGLIRPGLRVRVRSGAGSYVCGEETALLRAIEGERGEAAPKPPWPAERGLYGMPTVVQNVETLAVIPWLLRTGRRPETKAFSLSGAVARPGAVEAPFGISLRALLERGGGGPAPGSVWRMALVGGPMGTVIPADRFDQALSYEALPGLGHGGIVVLDQRTTARDLAAHLYGFAAGESCGNCAPCRIGTAQLSRMKSAGALRRLLDTMEMGSLCGFGQGVPRPIRDLLDAFPGEMP